MNLPLENATCPHCGASLDRIALPDGTGWEHPYHLVCFNDECSYYKEGWEWMNQQYEVNTSYRYRVNPESGKASPIAVWSEDALKNLIIKDAE